MSVHAVGNGGEDGLEPVKLYADLNNNNTTTTTSLHHERAPPPPTTAAVM